MFRFRSILIMPSLILFWMVDAPSYSGIEIGGGRIMGTETSVEYPNEAAFGMYNADQYMAPEVNYETVAATDNFTWYRQYATDTVERTPPLIWPGKEKSHTMRISSKSCRICRKGRAVYKWRMIKNKLAPPSPMRHPLRDHKLRYPYDLSNEMLSGYLSIMNRLTGMGNEMGTFIHSYIQVVQTSISQLQSQKCQ